MAYKERRSEIGDAATAHHEAGHAVAWCALGVGHQIEHATLDSETLLNSACVRIRLDRNATGPEVEIVATLAGPIAQRKYNPRAYRKRHGSGDHKRALELAGELAQGRLDELTGDAEKLVDEHWPAIEKVAALLLEHRTLGRYAIIDVFEGREPEELEL